MPGEMAVDPSARNDPLALEQVVLVLDPNSMRSADMAEFTAV